MPHEAAAPGRPKQGLIPSGDRPPYPAGEGRTSAWAWIPTLYLAEGLPYVLVMTVSVIMYKGFGISNTDIAISRRFAFGNQNSFDLRWEVFNLFNQTELGLPNSNISDAAVGTITRLAGDPRVMQFALRFTF